MADFDEVTRVMIAQHRHMDRLFGFPNVIGVATGYRNRKGEYRSEVGIQVFVSRKLPPSHLPEGGQVPSELPGRDGEMARVDVIEAVMDPLQDTTRYRPVQGGCSIGNLTRFNAGTLGGWACDNTDDSIVFLTNNHVVTASSNRQAIPANPGIVQPGRRDGGAAPADQIGQTKRIVPIPTNPARLLAPTTAVDAAVGTLTVGRDDDVLEIGPAIYEISSALLGMNVQKRGRTTGRTTNGRVTSVTASWVLDYGPIGASAFARIGTGGSCFNITSTDGTPFADRGDSGSLIFDQTEGEIEDTFPVVGLLFAGGVSGTGPFGTLVGACDINAVFNQLNLSTVCTCYVRALIEAIFNQGEATDVTREKAIASKEHQLRGFRDRTMRKQPFGGAAAAFIQSQIPRLSRAIFNDDEAFGHAVRAFKPWVEHPLNLSILEAEVDDDTVDHLDLLASRLVKLDEGLSGPVSVLQAAVRAAKGEKVSKLLGREVDMPGRGRGAR